MDAVSLQEVIDEHAKQMYNMIFRMVPSREDAQDLTQETFLRVVQKIDGFQNKSKLSTWIHQIALNVVRDYYRQREETQVLEENILYYDRQNDTEKKVLNNERQRVLLLKIHALKPWMKEVVILRDVLGYSYQEIAEIIQEEEGTVKSRISRARDRLREELKDWKVKS
ncbi:MAG TPA: RNA polymerase subunit sigma [Eubacteriaceae bacterium]|nr:RNA polymerase subunit sigma [Eubacteriaceae bacterium]